jgi:hypothetical protein
VPIFDQSVALGETGAAELQVPPGRTWKVQAIFCGAGSSGDVVQVEYVTPDAGDTMYYEERTLSAGNPSMAIGAPDPLPDIELPSGAFVQFRLPGKTGVVTFLIKD